MSTALPIIRITKEFRFEMAHALSGHDGPCKNIHGHSYLLAITVSGKPLDEPGSPAEGMVIDFNALKTIVKANIVDVFDHRIVLHEHDRVRYPELAKNEGAIFFPFPPTCEMLCAHITQRIAGLLPAGLKLHAVRLNETSTSFAEWYAEDN
jgi:6-pyruvoyltetrahydropterin/6-carboxytetrahydropterin synthase